MKNIALVVEYDGSNFYGFQKQRQGVRTIQNELESALSKFANHKIDIITAGRTDTGVHALFQVINFVTTARRKLYGWVSGVNALLPDDIVIREATDNIPLEFNARYDALFRTYRYYLLMDRVRGAIFRQKIGRHYAELNIEKMRLAGEYLIGKQDFSSFRASDCQAKTAIRNLTNFSLTVVKDNLICFEFTANAFLYHMVRNIIGALVFVGTEVLSVEEFRELILSCDRTKAPPTFAPDGLYLSNVVYAKEYFSYIPADLLF